MSAVRRRRLAPLLAPLLALGVLALTRAGAQANVTGTVYDSLVTRGAMRDAQVVIVELNQVAVSDRFGRFRFEKIRAGRYTIGFMHAVLDSFDLAAPQLTIEVPPAGTLAVELATPSPSTAYVGFCRGQVEPQTGAIYGRVRSAVDGAPVPRARVLASWLDMVLERTGRLRREWRQAIAVAGPSGAYFLCNVPTDIAVDVRAVNGDLGAGPLPVQSGSRLLNHQDFTVPVGDRGARLVLGDSGRPPRADPAAGAGSSTVAGTVKNSEGRAVAEALIGIAGFGFSVRTNDKGAFSISEVPAGTRAVLVRSIGAVPTVALVDLPEGGRADVAVTLDKQPQQLATVAVQGERSRNAPPASTGFSQRQKGPSGRFLTGDDIKRFEAWTLIDALSMVNGVRRERTSRGEIVTLRGARGRCVPTIFLDGTPVSSGDGDDDSGLSDLDASIRADQVTGIEVYAGAFIPPQYDRSSRSGGCGSIVIWTKR